MTTSVIALDIDGTLADYDYGLIPKINLALIAHLRAIHGNAVYALISNQGGLPFGEQGFRLPDGRPYPRIVTCVFRLSKIVECFCDYGLRVAHVRYCVFHPKANRPEVELTARRLREELRLYSSRGRLDSWHVYATQRARKPQPLMLHSVGATSFYGDSDEDREAAAAAGVTFFPVQRFRA